jgi:hypothetical protein
MPSDRKRELLIEARWRKCRDDFFYFAENWWYIQHPEHGAILLSLFDEQKQGFEAFVNHRKVITLKARQIGWSTLTAAYAFWLTYFNSDRLVIFLSKGEREAKNLLRMVKYGEARLPEWMRARGPRKLADNVKEMPFSNGSSIESLPSGSDPARGRSCYLVVVDEWAFLEDPEAAWASIEPIADVGGRIIGLSTANGFGNFFHTMWEGARERTNGFEPIFFPWSARADRDEDWYAAKAASLPDWQLHQEYPRDEEEAFLKSGNPFFDVDIVRNIVPNEDELRRGYLLRRNDLTFVGDPNGDLQLWEFPQIGEMYVIGADVAEGLEYGDYSSADVISLKTGKQVAHWHGHCEPDVFARVLADLGTFFNRALIGCEVNNHGLTTCKFLAEIERYPALYHQEIFDEKKNRKTKKVGWLTNKKTKPYMLDELGMEIRRHGIDVQSRRTRLELLTFVRDEDAKLHGSPHDDCVMSLAIANQMRDHGRSYFASKTAPPWGSLAWWEKQTHQRSTPARIGQYSTRGTEGTRY